MLRTITRSTLAIAALTALTGGVASAQSFNIEINASADSTGMPVFFFEGAAGQQGGWNNINASSNLYTLKNTDGALTNVTFKVEGQGSIISGPTPGMTGALANVMADYHAVNVGLINYTISNLEGGRYAVYVYAGHPSDPNARSQVRMIGDQWTDTQVIGGPKNGTAVDPGDLYSVHVVDLVFNDDLSIYVEPYTGTATCAAIQIKKLPGFTPLRMYVDDTATGDGHGASWQDGMNDLQEALRTASLVGGSRAEIWVAKGNYKPTSGIDRSATFRIPSGLKLYGGFFGNETTLDERTAPAFNITNLSGSIGASSQDDNSYTVVTIENANSQTLIDGFSISRGNNSALGVDSSGGGVRIINSSPTFRNTKFLSNWASVDGAGVYVKSGFPRFADCLFYNNALSLGAGAGLAATGAGNVTVYNSQFVKNVAGSHGGAAQLYGGAKFANCLFDGNFAPGRGGAINIAATGDVREINQCTFAGNAANDLGGAIHQEIDAPTNIFNSIMHNNSDHFGRSSVKGALQSVTVSYSIAENMPSGVNGVGVMDIDPRFADADGPNNTFGDFDDNFRLLRGSPAIETGSNVLAPTDAFDFDSDNTTGEIVPFDLDRKPRVRLTSYAYGAGGSPTIDMGAFEHQPTCPADLNADGVVNFADLNMVLTGYGTGSAAFDTNGDGVVNFADLNAVLAAFGADCAN